MLKKQNRMARNKEFDRAFKLGKSFYGPFLGIKAVDNNLDQLRLGILISSKVSKKAVVRNLYKRRIRELIRQELPNLKTGKDVVVIVSKQIIDKSFVEVGVVVKAALEKLKIYK